MARYIDADLLRIEMEDLYEHHIEMRNFSADGAVADCLIMLNNAPTADVVEVKHGMWEIKSEIRRYLEEIDEEFYVECPFCHRVYYVPFEFEDEKMLEYAKKNYPYCNCGAKMDGGKAE